MKGLLVKDFKLMTMQRNFLIVMVVIAAATVFTTTDTTFMVGFLSFIMMMFAVSTISYDDFDNGSSFLFTLPISRKGYVTEKYCFGMLLCLGGVALSLVLALFAAAIKEGIVFSETLASAPFILAGAILLLSLSIPMQIKFGAEKSRLALAAVGGIAILLSYGISKISDWLGFDIMVSIDNLSSINIGVIMIGTVALALCLMLLSMRVSLAIMGKKGF